MLLGAVHDSELWRRGEMTLPVHLQEEQTSAAKAATNHRSFRPTEVGPFPMLPLALGPFSILGPPRCFRKFDSSGLISPPGYRLLSPFAPAGIIIIKWRLLS